MLKPKIVKYHLPNDITLTNSQKGALDFVFDWYSSNDYSYRVIAGSAGVGKTYLTPFIVSNMGNNIVLCAPTHKATDILRTKVKGHTVHTLHKLLGIRPDVKLEEYDSNNPIFRAIGKQTITDYKVVIIDEASMINKGLFKLISMIAEDHNIKVLYIGDQLQLPPVGEVSSIVFEDRDKVFTIEEIIRQNIDNPLMPLFDLLRFDIPRRGNNFISFLYKNSHNINSDKEGYYIFRANNNKNKMTFQQQLLAASKITKETNNATFSKYLGFTNNNIRDWNTYIRNSLTKEKDILIKGDIITAYNTIVDEFYSPIITNSSDYVITNINDYININDLKGYLIQLVNTIDKRETPLLFVLDHTDNDNLAKFIHIHETLRYAAKTAKAFDKHRKWKDYYDFKDRILLMITIKDDNNKPIVYKDIDYGYAMTIHKSQGSTFNNVFVNILDILYDYKGNPIRDVNLRNRLIYVALSRASKLVMIYS